VTKVELFACIVAYRGDDKSLARPGRNKLGNMSGTRAISTTLRRELLSIFFPARQGAEGNSRHSDRNISLLLPGRTKDLSAPLYFWAHGIYGRRYLEG